MNDQERREAAYRCALRALSLVTVDDTRGHLGFDPGWAVTDVEAVHHYLRAADIVIPDPPPPAAADIPDVAS